MKQQTLNIFLAFFISFALMAGCSSQRNGIDKEKVTGAVKNFTACIAACDSKQAEYDSKFLECVRSKPIPESCWHVADRQACVSQHLARVMAECKAELKPLADEIIKCRTDCINIITKLEKDTQ